MSVHCSRNWKAIESTDFGGGHRHLTVTGEVQVGAGNEEAVLTEMLPGINKTILLLKLSTRTSGSTGTTVLTWKPVKFEKPVGEDEYAQVDIQGQAVVSVEKRIS